MGPEALERAVQPRGEGCTLQVRVRPNARKAGLGLREDGVLQVSVTAPAVEGAANEALVRWLARDVLGLSRSAVRVVRGERARDKVVEVDAAAEVIRATLSKALS